jgi:hypothetical protein
LPFGLFHCSSFHNQALFFIPDVWDTAFSSNDFAGLILLIHSSSLGGGKCSRNILSGRRYSNQTLDNMMPGSSVEVACGFRRGEQLDSHRQRSQTLGDL